MQPTTRPTTVRARKVVTAGQLSTAGKHEVGAVAVVAVARRVDARELSALDLDDDEADRWRLGGRPCRCQQGVRVELVDLAQLGHDAGSRRLRARGLQRL